MQQYTEKIIELYKSCFGEEVLNITEITAHGSARKYIRIESRNNKCLGTFNNNRKENEAFINYARQLAFHHINVPQIYAVDLDNDVYLQEDLGDVTLYNLLQSGMDITPLYKKVISTLPKIQMAGKDFDYSFAFPRKAFDRQSIEWDLQYFKYYYLKMAQISFNEQDLEKDFQTLTDYLLTADISFFLYRDFQSRNIMIVEGEPYFIDFQGGRKGALQYDIASLLFDAKANLSADKRKEFLDYYVRELKNYVLIDENEFYKLFYAFVYVRIMQAMGSYSYRGYFERKEHFLTSVPFAIKNIRWLEENATLPYDLPELHNVFKKITKLVVDIKSFSYRNDYPQDLSGNGGGFVFDCRALHNPGRYPEYKSLNGKNREVVDFLEKDENVKLFYQNAFSLVRQSIDTYIKRGFTYLSVSFGCTGGQHRSVYMAERLAKDISLLYSDVSMVLQHTKQ